MEHVTLLMFFSVFFAFDGLTIMRRVREAQLVYAKLLMYEYHYRHGFLPLAAINEICRYESSHPGSFALFLSGKYGNTP